MTVDIEEACDRDDWEPTGLGNTIFKDRYARDPEESWTEASLRLAQHVAQAEENGKVRVYEQRFFNQIVSGKFCPGGRIWYGAGRPKSQCLNCYVIGTSDSREGWGKTTSDVIVISGLMGGVGINLSPIRPRGSVIHGTGGYSTGAVSLMELINGVGDVIVGGGGRRMALMLCLDVNHPDIEEFLHVKLDLQKLTNANISIVIPPDFDTDLFVEKVLADEEIDLVFNGINSGKTIKAKELWDTLVENAWKSGEPGVLNSYLANKMNNIFYYAPVTASNPCVTGDTMVMTEFGPRSAKRLVGPNPIAMLVDGKPYMTNGFFPTGHKEVYTLSTKEGPSLNLTFDHQVMTDRGWIEAGQLVEGDKIRLHNHDNVSWDGEGTFEVGYSIGHWLGDGTLHLGKVKLESWGGSDGEKNVRAFLQDFIKEAYTHRSDFKGWLYNAQRDRYTLISQAVHKVIQSYFDDEYGLITKKITRQMLEGSSDLYRGIIAGLFDTDGHVEGSSTEGGISVRLSQSNLSLLETVQRMLLNLGIRSKIQKARDAGKRLLPDGKGGTAEFDCNVDWRLIITSDIAIFRDRIGFVNTDKAAKLDQKFSNMSRGFYNKSWTVTFESLDYVGVEPVYDVQVPYVNAFDANGLYVHNCGEQWLENYGACCLGALVLPRFVVNGEFDWDTFDESVRLGVRYLDNVLTVNHYPLPEIKENCETVRRVGLGIMGLHTMLLELGMNYDSEESFTFVDRLMNTMKNTAYDASINLAIEKGPFPAYDPQFLNAGFIKTLKRGLRNKIREHGIRNCAILTVAPTGTTSMMEAVSSGIEPLPPAVYWRNYFKPNKNGERELKRELVVEEAYYKYPDRIQSALDVPIESHFKMQAVVQKHIDNAVSKTINMAKEYPKDEFGDVWLKYLPQLKGTTVYRYGSRENEPINPVPREDWDAIIASHKAVDSELTVEEFMTLDCPDGACDISSKLSI